MQKNDNCFLTPVKKYKATPLVIEQFDKAANDLFSTAVAKIRQPMESFFSWIQEKTAIQKALKVRSKNRLLLHIYSKMAAAILLLLGF